MTFKFHCTCGQKVSATKDMIGTRATCPRCGASVKVPKPEEPPASEAASVAPVPAAAPASAPELAPVKKSEAPQKPATPVTADSGLKTPTPFQLAPAQPDSAATPKEIAEPKPGVTPAPLKIVPRPVGLLWAVAGVFAVAAAGIAAFLAWSHWDLVPKAAGIALAAIFVALPLGAIVLRQLSRLILRFDLGFSESLPVTILAASLALLAGVPAALSLLGLIAPEQGARLLPLTIGGALLLMIAAYGYLIRNALGRPVGVARGTLTFLIHLATGLLSAGLIVKLAKLVRS